MEDRSIISLSFKRFQQSCYYFVINVITGKRAFMVIGQLDETVRHVYMYIYVHVAPSRKWSIERRRVLRMVEEFG